MLCLWSGSGLELILSKEAVWAVDQCRGISKFMNIIRNAQEGCIHQWPVQKWRIL